MPQDTVFLRRMRLDASLGVYAWEREMRQPIEVDVEAQFDSSELLRGPNLAHGIDFNTMADSVRQSVTDGHTELVETLADRIARDLLARSCALHVVVEVRKYLPFASIADHAGVRVRRSKET